MVDELPREGPPEFGLLLGGPLYQLYLHTRIARPPLELRGRRIVVITLIAWLPLLLLSAVGGGLSGGFDQGSFLYDIEAQVRLLVALPLLISAEPFVHRWLATTTGEFAARDIVPAEELPKFRAAIARTMRLRNSIIVELLLVAFVYLVGHQVWESQIAITASTWYATREASGLALTPAGYWYAFVSIPIFQFILLRWYFRLCLWFWFLWQVSRLDLQLMPTHPDRAGGLGFLGESANAFGSFLLAQGAVAAGLIANRVFHEGQSLLGFKVDAAGFVALFVLIIFAPLTAFSPRLARTRRSGLRSYGILAERYVRGFEEKWTRDAGPSPDELLGTADIQSLADLDGSYQVVRQMRVVPFEVFSVLGIAAIAAVPFLVVAVAALPLNELVDRLLKIVF